MLSRIREVRKARKMSLQEVADRCRPPTTPQTIGRLETGARSISMTWLNRIAQALEVEATDLIHSESREGIPVAAFLSEDGARPPSQVAITIQPRPPADTVAVIVEKGIGDYRSGDEIWLTRLMPGNYSSALNRDVLVPRSGDRLAFGRLIGREANRLQILDLGVGRRQAIVNDAPWIAVATKLVRSL